MSRVAREGHGEGNGGGGSERGKLVLEVAGGVAGLAAFVYVVGGIVMWSRFHKTGVPADQAVALMSTPQLFVVGFRLMILPALVAGGLAWLILSSPIFDGEPCTPRWLKWLLGCGLLVLLIGSAALLVAGVVNEQWLMTGIAGAALIGVALLIARACLTWPRGWNKPGLLVAGGLIAVSLVVGAVNDQWLAGGVAGAAVIGVALLIGWARSARSGRWNKRALFGAGVLIAAWLLLLPVSIASLVWALAVALVSVWIWNLIRNQPPPRSRDSVAARFTAVAVVALFAALVSLAQQWDQPVQLLHANARVTKGLPVPPQDAVFVAADGSTVHLASRSDRRILAIKRDELRHLALGPPQPEDPTQSILSWMAARLSGDEDERRFSTKLYTWWCDGLQYSWLDLVQGEICRTQPRVMVEQYGPEDLQDADSPPLRDLHGQWAPVRVKCPTAAADACRAWITLESDGRFPYTRWTPETKLVLGPKRVTQSGSSPPGIEPGGAAEACLKVPGRVLDRITSDLHANPTHYVEGKADQGKGVRISDEKAVHIRFRAIVSSDSARQNILDESRYLLRIPLTGKSRPRVGAANGEEDASDCPSGRLQVFSARSARRYMPPATASSVTFHINARAEVSLTLHDRMGRLIRVLRQKRVSPEAGFVERDADHPDGPRRLREDKPIDDRVPWKQITGSWRVWENKKTITWRSVDREGQALPEGAYRIRLVAVGHDMRKIRRAWRIDIDAAGPRLRVINGGVLSPDEELVISAIDRRAGTCLTERRCLTSFRIDGKERPLSLDQGRWTYRPANGWRPELRYRWRLRACDRAGNCTRARGHVLGMAGRARR